MAPRSNPSTVAQLMREWRAVSGLSRAQAGAMFGLSSRSIEDIEQGRTREADELSRLALVMLLEDAYTNNPG